MVLTGNSGSDAMVNKFMNIAFTSSFKLNNRVKHFLNTLIKHGHNVFNHNNEIPLVSDIWLIDYLYTSNCVHDNKHYFNTVMLPNILKYKGKVMLVNLEDTGALLLDLLDEKLLERIDGVIALNRYINAGKHDIDKKTILIPRFTIDYNKRNTSNVRQNKFFFVGRLTGAGRFNKKNWRAEAFKKIYENDFLKDNFSGWLSAKDKKNFCRQDLIEENYSDTIIGTKPDTISTDEYYACLENYSISLCLPGNTAWGYRHLMSLASKSAIVSFDLASDSGEWLFQHVFNDSFYFIKKDLSNFSEILTYALKNPDETNHRAHMSYQTYSKYFELQSDDTYQDHVWSYIRNSFSLIGINL
jgi:hypothetical protein